MIRYSFWDIGVAGLRLCIMFSPATSISATTRHTRLVFPHLMMWGQPFFKKNMSWLMPDKRPTDNMELAVDLPQEEEFALANMMPYTYYNFWFLPEYQQEYADKYLLFDDITEKELKVFEETFVKLIKISLWNTKGTQFLSKNPPHTGRVKELVKMFPNASYLI